MFGLSVLQILVASVGALLLIGGLRWVVQREQDRIIRRLIVVGFVAKLGGTAAYYRVIADVYGSGDVTGYVRVGRELAPMIRSGTLPDHATQTGTRFMEFLAGVVFAVMGPSEIVAYLVFSLLSFVGMLALLKAVQMAVPGANHRRYAFFVLLFPTMVFWPSTIGKDAWLVLTLGVGAYGVARVLTRARFGYAVTLVSVAAMGAVRPHMAALFSVSFAAAYVIRMFDRDVKRSALGWVIGLVLVGGILTFATTTFSEEMGRSEVQEGSALDQLRADTDEIFERTDRNTRRGGGEFDSRPVRSPGDLLHAIVTVPYRPFPNEAHNLQVQLSSLEGLLLFALTILALPNLAKLPRLALRKPYVAFASVYTLGFIVAFANVGNFGILTRQRAQLLPFLFVILAFRWKRQRDERRPVLLPSTVERQATIEPHALRPAAVYGNPDDAGSELERTRRPAELIVDLPEGAVREPRPPP